MKILPTLYGLLFAVAGTGAGTLAGTVASAQNIAVTHATLYTGVDAEPVNNATILVKDGFIEAVGEELSVPAGYEKIDAQGAIVTPGLFESFSQIGLHEIDLEATTVDSQVTEYKLGPSFDISHAINPASTLFAINRMDGVTRAVIAPLAGNDLFAGWGSAIHLQDDNVITHTRLAQFAKIDSGVAKYVGGSRSAVVSRLKEALQAAPKFRASRYQPQPEDYSAKDMLAIQEMLASNKPLVIEVHRKNEILEALKLAEAHKVSLVLLGASEAWQVAEKIADAGVPVIIDPLGNLPLRYDRLGATLENAARLDAAGVLVAFTSQENHNARWLRRIAGNAVANGLPWHVGLAAITSVPARIYGLDNELGSISAGKRADLVVWSGDPLEITNWATRVMINGEWIEMRSRQTRLFERYKELDDPRPVGLQ